MRGGPLARRFWNRVWNAREFVHARWWENSAVIHLLGYRGERRKWPVVPTPWRAGVGRLDRAWNSIPGFESPRPHIAHFPGIDLRLRLDALSRLAAAQ
jgi:hypothetical protein